MTTTKPKTLGQPGDLIEVTGHHQGEAPRLGEILDALGERGHEHYRVRWEDGHVSVYYPGSDATVRPARGRAG